jgi:hypothetical protein
MAARRLLLLMLVLLAVSSLAAALVPQSEREEGSGTGPAGTDTGPNRPQKASGGRLVEETIDAQARRPRSIRLHGGDGLALTVRSRAPDQVEIPAFGLLEHVARGDPARFDLLPARNGAFVVRLIESRRVIGRIVVRPERRGPSRQG